MADKGGSPGKPQRGPDRMGAARTPAGFEMLVTALGGGVLDFPAMLAIADILPVMTGYHRPRLRLPLPEQAAGRLVRGAAQGHPRALAARHARRSGVRAAAGAARGGAGRRAQVLRVRVRPSDMGPVAVQTDYVPWADPSGEVRGIICVVEDVTEQRAAEGAMRESEARFRRIANSAPGDDVGDPARPRARLRQRGLCRIRLRAGLRP